MRCVGDHVRPPLGGRGLPPPPRPTLSLGNGISRDKPARVRERSHLPVPDRRQHLPSDFDSHHYTTVFDYITPHRGPRAD
eukprot:6538388-Prymnesium_polylepis.1